MSRITFTEKGFQQYIAWQTMDKKSSSESMNF